MGEEKVKATHAKYACERCNMDTCSGSCIQSGAMDFICLSFDYFALLELI